jgi:hypothetical protein
MKNIYTLFTLLISIVLFSQAKENSTTRNFIDAAEFTQVSKDWNVTADFKSGLGEVVSFYPVETLNLKNNKKLNSLQLDMTVKYDLMGKSREYFKSSWIDLDEIEEFTEFLEKYVIPNLKDKTEKKQSNTYIFNSREMRMSFYIERNQRRISIYLKDYGVVDNEHYFWTESQVDKVDKLLEMLKKIK